MKILIRFLAAALLFTLLAAPLTACKKEPDSDIALRFVVASDVHFVKEPGVQDQRLQKLYEQAYAYAAASDYKGLDGVFFAGDVTETGSPDELNRFFEIVKNESKKGTVSLATMGNHEFYHSAATAVKDFQAAAGYDSVDQHITLGEYHFILLSPDGNGNGFGADKQQWLSEQLAAAAATDETGKRPIFVFQHQHVSKTVYGSATSWGLNDLKDILTKYPQVVDFSGHSHFPINDPRSIWQGSFTALNTGSMYYHEMDLVGEATELIFAADAEGGFKRDGTSRADGGQYYIVEVGKQNDIRIRAFDTDTNTEIMDPIYLASVGDPAAFSFTDARKNTESRPAFATDAAASAITVGDTSAKFSFPQTSNETYVQNYLCELYQNGQSIRTVRRLACGFLFPTPKALTVSFDHLEPETTYTVKIIPCSAFGNLGDPLSFDFTTAAPGENTSGLIFSAEFNEGNSAKDAVLGTALKATGNPTTAYEQAFGKYVGVFDGSSAFEFHGMSAYYGRLEKSVSFEIAMKVNAFPDTWFVNPFSNQQAGGFGFEYRGDGKLYFLVNVGGTYYEVGDPINTGEWFHAVGTFDGNKVCLYVNGVLAMETAAVGSVTMPSVQYLSIGGDSEPEQSGCFTNCSIAIANVYEKALTAAEVLELVPKQ